MKQLQIEEKLKDVRNRIKLACKSVGRDRETVKLLLATKTVSAENINYAIGYGETLLGESKAQE